MGLCGSLSGDVGGAWLNEYAGCYFRVYVRVRLSWGGGRNWEERKQQSNWAQSRPTHGSETSPNRTHNNTQGDHEVRALQQPPNAVHTKQAISKHPPLSLYKVPTYSTRAGAAPRAPGGARHGGGNRAVTSQPRMGQSTSHGDVKSSYGGAGGWDRRGCATGAPKSANRQGEEQHRTREPHQEVQGRAHQTRRRGTARQERQPEQQELGTRMERMVERAHWRQRQ